MPALPASLQYIVDRLAGVPEFTPQQVRDVVREARVDPADLLPWADFDHPSADSYGRKLAYDGGTFEIMVMSWAPGDFSAMHDHGYTQWGAVQVFGPAEHAVCAQDVDRLVTLSRVSLSPGRVIAVGHDLVHQMGNPTEKRFLSLHVYGCPDRQGDITADARVFDFSKGEVCRTDGGVFYSLPDDQINTRSAAPEPDYYTFLFDAVQNLRRRRRAGLGLDGLLAEMTSERWWEVFKEDIEARVDENGHHTDSRYWTRLFEVLRAAAELQGELIDNAEDSGDRHWRTYAALYDHVIGTTNSYIPGYLAHAFERYGIDAGEASMVDVGCGTGWLQPELVRRLGMNPDRLLGLDPSPAMVAVASERTSTRRAGLLDLDESFGRFDVAFCNSYQYLRHEEFDEAVGRVASVTRPGGVCVSEFITPDHIRWYPNVVFSESDRVISLRQPSLHERDGAIYQESEIINVSRLDGMRVTHEGVHRRFLPSAARIREVFRKHFGDSFVAIDGKSFDELSPEMETCPSTRYVVLARLDG